MAGLSAASAAPCRSAPGAAVGSAVRATALASSLPLRGALAAETWGRVEAPSFVVAAAATALVLPRRRGRARAAALARAAKRAPRWAPTGSKGSGLEDEPIVPTSFDDPSKRETALKIQDEKVEVDLLKTEVVPGNGRCYRVTWPTGIGLRVGPEIGAERNGEDLLLGEIFEVRNEVRRAGRRYFQLADGRGWAFDSAIDREGNEVGLVELAAQLYTVVFPDGVNGIIWSSDTTMRFTAVNGFSTEPDAATLTEAGVRPGDIIVMIDQDPVAGMPFGSVLERIWAASGRQPGNGLYYQVITEGAYGIGVREDPDIDSPRTGVDLVRGHVFEVDDIIEEEGKPTYLHLADDSGWVFDTSPIDPERPSVVALKEKSPKCALTMWRGDPNELAATIGLKFKQDRLLKDGTLTVTVVEEGQPVQRILAKPGANLRKTLVDSGFQIYSEMRALFNCNAQQLCGTCVLDVVDGGDNLTVRSVNEQAVMAANPPSYRLCCNIDVYGDVVVRLRPYGVTYGGGTS
mmetsp:Transcript_54556/g.119370  ORF Transcript_54556/g.119370 Transcript_54556/m.119370 type:complete len:517 (-) Transcript_54556:91-1641(-)